MNFKNLSELNRNYTKDSNFVVNVKQNNGLIHNTYTYEMRFPKGFNASSVKADAKQHNESIAASNTNDKDLNVFIDKIPFENDVTLPGKIISSNAIKSNGNKLTWNYYLSQITPDTVMTATYTLDNKQNEIVFTLIGVVAFITVGIYLYRVRKKLRTE